MDIQQVGRCVIALIEKVFIELRSSEDSLAMLSEHREKSEFPRSQCDLLTVEEIQ